MWIDDTEAYVRVNCVNIIAQFIAICRRSKMCAVKAQSKNVDKTSGIQVPDEPLELSSIDHSME